MQSNLQLKLWLIVISTNLRQNGWSMDRIRVVINLLLYANNAHNFQSISATHLTVTENQIKCDLLRTMPNNERFRSADCDGVRF